MKTLVNNELNCVAGGNGKSEVRDGLLVAWVDIPSHVDAQTFSVSMLLNDPTVKHS